MASIKEIILLLRSNGLEQVLRILRFTLARGGLDTPYYKKMGERNQMPAALPGMLKRVVPHQSGASFSFENAELQVQFLAGDLVRLTWLPGSLPPPYALEERTWPEIYIEASETEAGWRLASSVLRLVVGNQGELNFMDSAGRSLRRELPPERHGNGDWAAWTARIQPEEGSFYYGLGDQAGPFNLAGTAHEFWNTDPGGSFGPGTDPLYMPLPVYCCQHAQGSYLLFYENAHKGSLQFSGGAAANPNSPTTVQFERGALQAYFIAGPVQQAVERFGELTGKPELPPLWSLGYHQSRWGYKTSQDIEEVAQGFKDHDMPLSAIHLDIDYMDGYRVFTVDRQRFPDLAGLTASLDTAGIKTVPIIDPGVKVDEKYPVYKEGLQQGCFCRLPDGKVLRGLVWPGWSVYPDFTDPKTRVWWDRQYQPLLDAGVAGIWHDMNEPTSFSAWGGMALPLATRHNLDGTQGDHLEGHNLFALEMNHAGYQALKEARPERRPWLISRAGWVSQQRYTWKWSGDTESSWGSLRMTIANALGMGLSGQPYTGPDIGGFSGSPTPELYLRWFQMAAFLPFFRTHSAVGTARREPWVYGEPYTSIVRQFLKLRYRLLPYLYSLAWETSRTGRPLVRPLFWHDTDNRDLWGVDDAFLLGDRLLIAPVLQENAASRIVHLPHGEWVDYWGGRVHQGGQSIEVPVNLETIPVFVRAGSILPEKEGEVLHLGIYAPGKNEPWLDPALSLYSDAGDGYGNFRVDNLIAKPDTQGIDIHWESQGAFPFPYTGIQLDFRATHPVGICIDGVDGGTQENVVLTAPFKSLRITF